MQKETDNISLKIKLASYISVIGNPLFTFPVFTLVSLFTYEPFYQALFHSSLILLGIFLPVTAKMYIKTKNGTYTNFDVSDQVQRQSWYRFALILLLIVTIILFVTGQPRTLSITLLLSLILLGTAQLMNYIIKSSLHVSLNIFLAFLIIQMSVTAGLLFFIFTTLIAWARLTLKRHTTIEIIAGFILGLSIGIISLLVLNN